MATFRGTIQGARGSASRLGHSNLSVRANGWGGGVSVYLYREGERDCADIWLTPGSGSEGERVNLFNGPIDALARNAIPRYTDCKP